MVIDALKFRGYGCFVNEWAGFDQIKPINLIIGRNNSGKSQLLDLVFKMCSGLNKQKDCAFLCSANFDEETLRRRFPENHSGGDLPGNHWHDNGSKLVGLRFLWEKNHLKSASISEVEGRNPFLEIAEKMQMAGHSKKQIENYQKNTRFRVEASVAELETSLNLKEFRRLLADRDIAVEPSSTSLELSPDGRGATNIIRRHINSTSADVSREVIEHELLNALNEIFGEDGHFEEIRTQEHDEPKTYAAGSWEIHLGEKKKGLIPLSKSGSGLKTVILVLLNLLVIPKVKKKQVSEFVFAFEELENNLHPALLRRLLRYIDRFIKENNSVVFLTTHSNVALDMFGSSENAQIILVNHDGETARTSTIDTHFRRHEVLGELGARPSDILQANGIIWVEGPSDVVYLNKWIEIASGGQFKEGRDYLCAFYDGALLARTQFTEPDSAADDLVNLFAANPNFFVVCDSDKASDTGALKDRVARIKEEVSKTPFGKIWITQGKEIENYLSGSLLREALGKENEIENPGQYERFFPSEKTDGNSYAERVLGMKHVDKMDLAMRTRPYMSKEKFVSMLDWDSGIKELIETIRSWNA